MVVKSDQRHNDGSLCKEPEVKNNDKSARWHILIPRLASETRLVQLSTNIRSQPSSGCEKRAWNEDVESTGTDLPAVTARFAID